MCLTMWSSADPKETWIEIVKERKKRRERCVPLKGLRSGTIHSNTVSYAVYRRNRRTYCILSWRAIKTGVKVYEELQSVDVYVCLL